MIRSHPAFSEIPVEKFDKLAVEIMPGISQRDKFYFLLVISGIAFLVVKAMFVLSNLTLQIPSRIWITLKKGGSVPYGGMFPGFQLSLYSQFHDVKFVFLFSFMKNLFSSVWNYLPKRLSKFWNSRSCDFAMWLQLVPVIRKP